jgi:hypothetical protein
VGADDVYSLEVQQMKVWVLVTDTRGGEGSFSRATSLGTIRGVFSSPGLAMAAWAPKKEEREAAVRYAFKAKPYTWSTADEDGCYYFDAFFDDDAIVYPFEIDATDKIPERGASRHLDILHSMQLGPA